jgi:hypothetical protein
MLGHSSDASVSLLDAAKNLISSEALPDHPFKRLLHSL